MRPKTSPSQIYTRCNKDLTRELVSNNHMSRRRFLDLFDTIIECRVPENLVAKLHVGERVRDKVVHGMKWDQKEARQALVSVLDFAEDFNDFVDEQAGFRPFGDLRGFKGRTRPLGKKTTRWVLIGMGI